MNKTDLIEVVSQKLGDRRAASEAVEAVIDGITRAVAKGEKVGITGFGVFEKVERAARTARNPTTGAAVKLKKTSVPKFRPGQGFKDIVSGAKKVPAGPTARAVTARLGAAARVVAPAKASKAAPAKAATKAAPAKAAPAKAAAKTATPKAVVKAPATKVAAKAPATKVAAKAATKASATKVAAKAPVKSAATKSPAKKAAARR
ncbi:MAG: HU family DNA-binding protein [Frankiales bacterium]|nr:HU family DNA-binding protein [Frankiales bacterium]